MRCVVLALLALRGPFRNIPRNPYNVALLITGPLVFNVSADLFNVMNSNTELGRTRRLNSAAFGQLNDILSPRIARITVGIKF